MARHGGDDDGERRSLLHARSSSSLLSPSDAAIRRPISYGAASSSASDIDVSPSDLSSGFVPRKPKTWREKLVGKGAIVRFFIVVVLWSNGRYGPVAAAADSTRSYSCGAYYQRHPELIDAPGMDKLHPCAAPAIEASTARLLLQTSVVEVLGSALSVFLLSPKLSTWGRKPILLIAICAAFATNGPFLFLPHTYPYGPVADKVAIPPSVSEWFVVVSSFVGGLLGSDSLFLCSMRCILIDLSSPSSRSKLLILLMIGVMAGLALGPLIAGLAATYFPIDAQHLVHDLAVVLPSWTKHPRAPSSGAPSPSPADPGLPVPVPLPPRHGHPHKPAGASHNNVTPFIVSIFFTLLALVVCWLITPETLQRTEVDGTPQEGDDDDNKSKPKKSELLSSLQLLLPIRSQDGRNDWRLARVLLSQICILTGASATNTLIAFVGGPYNWSPEKVGYLLSWIASSRSFALLVLTPAALAVLEKLHSLRPASLQGYSVDFLKSVGKLAKSDEVPGGESTFVDPAEHGRRALAPIVTLWRANIDLTFARFSFAAEVIGWTVISAGATFFSGVPLPIFLGTSLLACGGGGFPSLQGAGVTIATDVLSSAASANKRALKPADVYLSVSSLLESVVGLCGLVIYESLYSFGLDRFPALPFVVAGCAYAVGSFCISTIRVHRTTVGQSHA